MTRRYQVLSAILLIVVAVLAANPGRGLRVHVARMRLFISCAREIAHISSLTRPGTSQNLIRTLEERPNLIGMAAWPYINSLWTPSERFAAMRGHYDEVEHVKRLHIGAREQLTVADLSDIMPGLAVVIDRPIWFMREGELSVNLFKNSFRAYSLAFTFGRVGTERVLYVGCLQGRQADGVATLYRDLTKRLHGWRPRDVMVSLVQMIGSAVDATSVQFVSDQSRVHRHKYFSDGHDRLISANYDEIWREHGAVPRTGGFFELPTRLRRRSAEDIPPQKRAMYRRRYELMARLEADVVAALRAGMIADAPVTT